MEKHIARRIQRSLPWFAVLFAVSAMKAIGYEMARVKKLRYFIFIFI
ncbi:hypothetical protein C4K18_3473 [Pseudomonas chlororaphis subsp. aurantiaca]|nr:hypothetical protein C4K18_3473 [Pseudomonas chlororaphis subsp. aurantiaca]